MNKTKANKPRKGKVTITHKRLIARQKIWIPLRDALRYHLQHTPKGEASRIARSCGIPQSQIHRYLCDKCEHDQEPCFTVGTLLLAYLQLDNRTYVLRKNESTFTHHI